MKPDIPGHWTAMVNRLRDLRRGYTDDDIESVRHKLDLSAALRPGTVTYLTRAEVKAWTNERFP